MATSTFGTTDPYSTGQTNVNNAANSGNSAIGSFDPNAWASSTQGGLNALWNKQGTTQNDYMTAYKNAISANPSAQSLYDTANEKFNVIPLQNTANTLNNTMLNTPNSNLAAARGFNYDQNQIDQKTSQDLQRLAPAAGAATTNANTAMTNAGNYVTQGMEQNKFNLLPIQQQGQYLMDSYARQQSGFTTVAQSQLQSLQAKMQAGVQLSVAEMSAYASLTASESSYQSALASANAEVQKQQIASSNQVIGQGGTYFNPSTNGYYTPNVGSGKVGA